MVYCRFIFYKVCADINTKIYLQKHEREGEIEKGEREMKREREGDRERERERQTDRQRDLETENVTFLSKNASFRTQCSNM